MQETVDPLAPAGCEPSGMGEDRLALAHPSTGWFYWFLAAALTLTAVGFVFWRAWVCDDAFITFRHVENCLAGYGPVFNPGERVQAFTHPLWFLLLLAGAARFNIYAFTIVLSLLLTASAVCLLAFQLRRAKHREIILPLVVAFLCSSPAFVEFQTSGLENSLTNLLVVLVFGGILFAGPAQVQPWQIALGCALLLCDRPDNGLLCLPLLGWAIVEVARRGGRGLIGFALGLLPAVAWYGFATLYYGTPLPNTFYAKVSGGLVVTLARGAYYLCDYARVEPVHGTLLVSILMAALVCSIRDLRARRTRAILQFSAVIGLVLHLLYIIAIGGDYMRGRFVVILLVSAAIVGAFVLERLGRPSDWPRTLLLITIVLVPLGALFRFAGYLLVGPMTGFMSLRLQPLPVRCMLVAAGGLWIITAFAVRRASRNNSPALATATIASGFVALFGAAGFWSFNLAMAAWLTAGFLSCSLLLLWPAAPGRVLLQAFALTCVAGLSIARPYSTDEVYPVDHGISDEYCWYSGEWNENRFIRPARSSRGEWWNWASIAEKARRYADVNGPVCIIHEALGIFSYDAGPKVCVLDTWGLSDAFISRCAARDVSRSGHIRHDVPLSYCRARGALNLLPDWERRLKSLDPTLRQDALEMMAHPDWDDPAALQQWETVEKVISGPLFSGERLRLIAGFIFPKRLALQPQVRRLPADLRSALPGPIVPPRGDGRRLCEAPHGPFRQTTPVPF